MTKNTVTAIRTTAAVGIGAGSAMAALCAIAHKKPYLGVALSTGGFVLALATAFQKFDDRQPAARALGPQTPAEASEEATGAQILAQLNQTITDASLATAKMLKEELSSELERQVRRVNISIENVNGEVKHTGRLLDNVTGEVKVALSSVNTLAGRLDAQAERFAALEAKLAAQSLAVPVGVKSKGKQTTKTP